MGLGKQVGITLAVRRGRNHLGRANTAREDMGSSVPVPGPVWTSACLERRGEHGRNLDSFTRTEPESWTEANPTGYEREEGDV